MTLTPIAQILCVVSGVVCAFAAVNLLRFALIKIDPDPAKGRRLAALFAAAVCGLASLFAAQVVFFGF